MIAELEGVDGLGMARHDRVGPPWKAGPTTGATPK